MARKKPHATAVDAMLADPRLAAVMDEFTTRLKAGRPVRWHVLTHDILGCQMDAGPDLALVTDSKWRLARAGIATTLTSRWITLWPPRPEKS
jgi:hypothetical protein